MDFRAVAVLAVLLAGAFAGCLQGPSTGTADVVPVGEADLLALLASLPEPDFDGMSGVNWWEKFVKDHDMRQYLMPKNHLAAATIESELKSAGFQSRIIYNFGGLSHNGTTIVPAQGNAPFGFRVVQGLKEGVGAKDHRLVLVSHIDTFSATRQGAFDNGSGIAIELSICKLLAKVATNKTIECLFFDSEENGLLASQAYTNWYVQAKPPWTWDQAFGYDMVGLNWPGYPKWKLYSMIGKPSSEPDEFLESHMNFLDVLAYDYLGPKLNVTTAGIEILPRHDRRSDEQNFKRVGVPILRFASGRRAADYPQYHKNDDTVEFVYKFACDCDDLAEGKKTFAAGFEMAVLMSYYTVLAYDRYDPKALPF